MKFYKTLILAIALLMTFSSVSAESVARCGEPGARYSAIDCYQMAFVYEHYLDNKEKAMEYYKKVLLEYPGSIYTAEARKKFRALRGDRL